MLPQMNNTLKKKKQKNKVQHHCNENANQTNNAVLSLSSKLATIKEDNAQCF